MNDVSRRRKSFQTFFRMMGFLKPFKWIALLAGLFLVLKIAVEVVAVYFLSPVVTTVSQNLGSQPQAGSFWNWLIGGSTSAQDLRSVLLLMAASQLALSLMTFVRSVWDTKFSQAVARSMRERTYDHLQYLEFSFYDRMTSGKLMSRALGDLDAVHGFVNTILLSILDITVSISAYVLLLGWRSPWLVLTAMIPLPLWCWVIFRFSKRSGPLYGRQREAADQMMGVITENVAGKHVVRAFGSARFENAKFHEKNEVFLDRLLSVIRWQATLNPFLQSLAIASHITVFFVCSALIQRGTLPIGDLLILGAAMGTILGKLQHINGIAEGFQRAIVSGERLFEVLDSAAETPQTAGKELLRGSRGDIKFENVTFSYGAGEPVLRDLYVTVRGGRVTALIGPTGSGKTTLSALLARFYSPSSGRVTISGQDIASVTLRDLRRHVGFVFQETFLFSASIRDNIRYGRTDVSEEMLKTAARVAHAHEFIMSLPQGYDTRIGEGGVQLSGGQRQRLALARALVYDPEILVLDDAMAALDASTEALIRERLKELRAGRTVIMITHRASSLALADQVLVMKQGRIELSGRPQDIDLTELPFVNPEEKRQPGLFLGANADMENPA